jgi:hypothetical protein
MAIKQITLAVLGLAGIASLAFASAGGAQAQQDLPDLKRATIAAPPNGVVMTQDDDNVYVYDAGKEKMVVVSKSSRVGDAQVPQTWVINTKTMKGVQVSSEP